VTGFRRCAIGAGTGGIIRFRQKKNMLTQCSTPLRYVLTHGHLAIARQGTSF